MNLFFSSDKGFDSLAPPTSTTSASSSSLLCCWQSHMVTSPLCPPLPPPCSPRAPPLCRAQNARASGEFLPFPLGSAAVSVHCPVTPLLGQPALHRERGAASPQGIGAMLERLAAFRWLLPTLGDQIYLMVKDLPAQKTCGRSFGGLGPGCHLAPPELGPRVAELYC